MKKLSKIVLIFLVFVLLTSVNATKKNEATIASFNTLHLGYSGKDYKEMAKVLKNFDLIGLQEVMNKDGVDMLVEELNNIEMVWSSHISEKPVGKQYKEYYAYVWRIDRVDFLKSHGFYKEKNNDDFIREPYGADFRMGYFDFTYVICHFVFGKNKKERCLEAQKLHSVYNYFQTKNGDEDDVIIAGDFNMSGHDKNCFGDLLDHDDDIQCMLPKGEKTTVNKSLKLISDYDNFFVSQVNTKNEAGKAMVYNYLQQYKKISDHLPIYLIVYTDKDDD